MPLDVARLPLVEIRGLEVRAKTQVMLSGVTEYWQIILGPLLLLVVLFARGGIDGLLRSLDARLGRG